MKRTIVTKTIVILALVAILAFVVVGLYAALDPATVPYAPTPSTSPTGSSAEGVLVDTKDANERDGRDTNISRTPEDEAPVSVPLGEDENGNAAAPVSPPQIPAVQGNQAPVAPTNTPPVSNTARTPSNGGSADAATPAAPQKVWHEAVYETVHHEAVYATVHHDAEYSTTTDYYTVCHQCAFKIQGSIYPHLDATGHTGYNSDVPFERSVCVREAYDEQVLVSAAYDEQVLIRAGYWQ